MSISYAEILKPKWFISREIINLKSWSGETIQLARIELGIGKDRLTRAAQAAFFHAQKAEETIVELCGRTKPGGGKCGSPTLRGKSFCYFREEASQPQAEARKAAD
jgi:hypothetical protein